MPVSSSLAADRARRRSRPDVWGQTPPEPPARGGRLGRSRLRKGPLYVPAFQVRVCGQGGVSPGLRIRVSRQRRDLVGRPVLSLSLSWTANRSSSPTGPWDGSFVRVTTPLM